MSDTNDTTQKPSGGKTLSLKKTETSTVKQSFSHGRTKAVVVEKKRTLGGAPVAPTKAPAETKVASFHSSKSSGVVSTRQTLSGDADVTAAGQTLTTIPANVTRHDEQRKS